MKLTTKIMNEIISKIETQPRKQKQELIKNLLTMMYDSETNYLVFWHTATNLNNLIQNRIIDYRYFSECKTVIENGMDSHVHKSELRHNLYPAKLKGVFRALQIIRTY